MSLETDLKLAVQLARESGTIALQQYGKVERLTKTHAAASQEAVTEADRAVQRHIVAGLRKRFPRDGIIGEESDSGESITFDCADPMGRNWVIDPIDGTNNFISGLGNFAVCIGLLDAGRAVLGVVYDVTRDAMYAAAAGHGAMLNARPIHAADSLLSDSSVIMMTSNLLDAQNRLPEFVTRWLSQTNWKIRILGSAAVEAVQVASGVAHAAVTINGKLWDAAAPAAIVLESGGRFTDFAGEDVFPFDLSNYTGAKVPFLAAAPAAHVELIRQLRSGAER